MISELIAINELNQQITNTDSNNNHNNAFSTLIKKTEHDNPDSIVLNMKNKNINDKSSNQKQYRDINSYKPEGNLVYTNDMMKRLNINI